jgi:hypothetical protein
LFRLITDEYLNVLKTDGSPDPDVLAIGDAAEIRNTPLPATAQGQPAKLFFFIENSFCTPCFLIFIYLF